MNTLIDLTGKRFGKLLVTGLSHKKTRKNGASVYYWSCKCNCGATKSVVGYSLTSDKTKSCGCLNKQVGRNHPTWKGYEDISASFFRQIKWSARSRGIKFDLKVKDIWNLFIKQNKKCALSGLPLSFPKYALDTDYNISLDRIDSSEGYTPDNVQWVDKRINFMKITLKQEEFVKMCNLVAKNHPIKAEVAV
jgi:hypothetical protein